MDKNGKCMLKNGVAPMLYLTLFSMQNDKLKEESRLSRRVRLPQDLEYADNQHTKSAERSLLALVTPMRDSRNSKHCIEMLQIEVTTRVKKFNENVILDM